MSRYLYVDCQILQTPAWDRGMGKYTFALLNQLLIMDVGYDEIHLVFNSRLQLSKDAEQVIGRDFKAYFCDMVDMELPISTKDLKKTQDYNRRKLEDYIGAEKIANGTDFIIMALFADEACPVFPGGCRNMLLMYDLIPYLYHSRYVNRIDYKGYIARFSEIFKADKVFTISATVADDCEVFLGLKKDRLLNINGAYVGDTRVKDRKYKGVSGKFIFLPSGDEIRKNNLRAVQAFQIFNELHDNQYTLVINSNFSDYTKKELRGVSESIHFTGHIPLEELIWIIKNSEFVFFPSEYEGLGLPILEAVAYDRPITCSSIGAFNEISDKAFYYFDPLDIDSIVDGLIRASINAEWTSKFGHYSGIKKKYTWKNSAKSIADYLGSPVRKASKGRPKLAIMGPAPDGFSAIGKVIMESHQAFLQVFDVTYFFEAGPSHRPLRPDFISSIANVKDISELNASSYKEFDAAIYHIGNGEYHMQTIINSLYLPGYVILHDTNLQLAYQDMLEEGLMTASRYNAEKELDALNRVEMSSYLQSIISRALGVFIHSNYASDAIAEIGTGVRTKTLSLPVATPDTVPTKNVPNRKKRIGLAGILAGVKGLEVIEQIAMTPEFEDCDIRIFGLLTQDVFNRIEHHSNISLIANPSDYDFQKEISELDVLINYRMQYKGESSLTTLEAMRYGVPVVVRNVGWYAELPDDAVIKVDNVEHLLSILREALSDTARLRRISKQARLFTMGHHSHMTYVNEISTQIKNDTPESSMTTSDVVGRKLKAGVSKKEILEFLRSI